MSASRLVLASIVMSALLGTPGARANLLSNPSFETGDFSGWSTFGSLSRVGVAHDATLIADTSAPYTPAFVNVRSGDWAAFGSITAVAGEYLGLNQTLNLAGGSYTAGFFMGNDSASAADVNLAIGLGSLSILVDGVIVPFSIRPIDLSTGSLGSDMHEFGISFVVAPGLHKVEYRLTAGDAARRLGVSFDDFYVNGETQSVVEPSTLALAAFGFGVVAIRRRRKFASLSESAA